MPNPSPQGETPMEMLRRHVAEGSWNLYAADETVPMREFRWRPIGRSAEPFPHVEGARLPDYEGAD